MGKAHFSVLKMGKSEDCYKCLFFSPILGEDYNFISQCIFSSLCGLKDICVQLARYIQDSFCHYCWTFPGLFFERLIAKSGKGSQLKNFRWMKSHQNYLAFLEKQKFVNKSFASSNIYFTSEQFPLINEDGDISNSLDWILSSLETKSSKSILSVCVLKLRHQFLVKGS